MGGGGLSCGPGCREISESPEGRVEDTPRPPCGKSTTSRAPEDCEEGPILAPTQQRDLGCLRCRGGLRSVTVTAEDRPIAQPGANARREQVVRALVDEDSPGAEPRPAERTCRPLGLGGPWWPSVALRAGAAPGARGPRLIAPRSGAPRTGVRWYLGWRGLRRPPPPRRVGSGTGLQKGWQPVAAAVLQQA